MSAFASAKALKWGFSKVYYFAGGYPAWVDNGYPVEVASPQQEARLYLKARSASTEPRHRCVASFMNEMVKYHIRASTNRRQVAFATECLNECDGAVTVNQQ